ncbi:MAG: hypothetical protein PUC36_07620 [Clostridiales bacterium]|nr:hypothetical protein [Clostridiales bacterium]
MESEENTLCRQLAVTDTSLGFLLIVIASILLSLQAVVRQREALCLTLEGRTEEAARTGDVFTLRCRASALIIGALGFFLCLAVQTCREAQDPVSCRSAAQNLWASILVLAAAIIRMRDLKWVEANSTGAQQEEGALAESLLED